MLNSYLAKRVGIFYSQEQNEFLILDAAGQSSHVNGYVFVLQVTPIKQVVSGEQSVGKSYALNHFVDSSFAGSAMRCTEGVWLSITPTSDMLIVALDFEGIQCENTSEPRGLTPFAGIGSIERTGQEGTHRLSSSSW